MNKNILLWLALMLSAALQVHGQNLVTNPGFELMNRCPKGRGEIFPSPAYNNFYTVLDWVSPTSTTPDYFSRCGIDSSVKVPFLRFDGYHEPRHGDACAGLAMFAGFPKTYHTDYWSEFLETRLSSPLVAGHDYYMSYYVCFTYHAREHSNIIATDRIGARLTVERTDTICNAPMFFVNGPADIETPPGLFISDTINWTLISGIYHAKGGEQWLTIGRFFNDQVNFQLLYSPVDRMESINCTSYMLIDDVCVIDLETPTGTDTVVYSPDFPIKIGRGRPAGDYLWENGDTSLQTEIPGPGIYLRKRWTECRYYMDTFTVDKMPVESCLWLPTAFTPNSDGKNDFFGPGNNYCNPDFQNFNFSIYNRWGQPVFQTSGTGDKWDGTFNGKPQEVGVYFYVLQYSYWGPFVARNTSPSGIHTLRGDVTLLR